MHRRAFLAVAAVSRKLREWWRVWRRWGVPPWQYEADKRALRRAVDVARELHDGFLDGSITLR